MSPSTSTDKEALVALRALRGRMSELEARELSRNEPVAIIGMGCLMPGGGSTPEAFWRMLAEGWTPSARFPPTAGPRR